MPNDDTISRYDEQGRLSAVEHIEDGTVVSRDIYDESGKFQYRESNFADDATFTREYFDDNGQLTVRESFEHDGYVGDVMLTRDTFDESEK